jgi:hypothetical protein
MRKLGYLVVEGPHDVEFAYRLMRSRVEVQRVRGFNALDEALKVLVPRSFPHADDLEKRVPVPLFLQNEHMAIAIHAAGGDSRVPGCLAGTLDVIPAESFFAVGVLLDTDSAKTPDERHGALLRSLEPLSLTLHRRPGAVHEGPPRAGAFVLPDNLVQGTLEDLLLESAELAYPQQLAAAKGFVHGIAPQCTGAEFADLMKPAGQKKAVIGSLVSLLRPGKAMQVSIQDNQWLKGQALQLASIKRVADFLDELFGLTH